MAIEEWHLSWKIKEWKQWHAEARRKPSHSG
jgi:hypothetical protein